MGYIVASILFLYAVFQRYIRKTWIAPDTIFCYGWSVISLLAAMHLFTMYQTSTKTWFIILVGTIAFCIGCSFAYHVKIGNTLGLVTTYKKVALISSRTFWLFVLVIILSCVSDFHQSYTLMKQGVSLGQIREASFGIIELTGYNYNGGAANELLGLIRGTLEITIVAYAIEEFIRDARKGAVKLAAVLAVEVIIAFTFGGRFALANFCVELVVCFFFYRHFGNSVAFQLPAKVKRWIRRVLVLMAVFFVALTLIRGADKSELLVKYYRYFCGDIKFFDLHVQELDKSGFESYGYAALYGLWNIILPVFNKLGLYYPERYLKTIEIVLDTQTFRQIGTELHTNAFITPFYHLYADFRWLGVIFGMFVFGTFCGILYKKAKNSMQPIYISCYLVISQLIFMTISAYPLVSSGNVLWLLLMFLLLGARSAL